MLKLIAYLDRKIQAHKTEDEGATMVEYGLVVTLIALAAITAATLVGTNLAARFAEIAAGLV
jgi:pilus assembly protein Flp/PilA